MDGCQDTLRSPALHRARGPHSPMNTLVFFIFSGLMLGLLTLINGKQITMGSRGGYTSPLIVILLSIVI